MSRVSDWLSVDHNRHVVGVHGGRGPKDINNSSSNRIERQPDEDHDGKPDRRISQELSEASAHLTGYDPIK